MTDVERRPTPGNLGASGLPVGAPRGADPTDGGTDTAPWRRLPSARGLAVAAGLLYLPFVGLGYGTDIDITNVRRSGETILSGDYRYSRPPGAFPHEAVTGVLDRFGGAILVNLGSVAAAVVTLAALADLVGRKHGERSARIAVVITAAQPWFWVAATSLGDYLYALGALLLGAAAAQRDRRVLAGLAFGLAIGFRSGTALLVLAYLLAEVSGASIGDDPRAVASATRRQRGAGALRSGVVAVVAGLAWFVPSWLSVGRTTQFLENQLRAGDFFVMVGRWGVKNIAFFGLVLLLFLLVRAPVALGALARFGELVLVRFAVFAAVATELLFLRFPWKPAHLLPVVVCLSIVLAVGPRTSNRFVAGVVACELLLAVVSVSIAAPDVPNAATSGRFDPAITAGVVVNDVDCRLDPPFEGTWPALDTIDADLAAIRVFGCQARSWRGGPLSG